MREDTRTQAGGHSVLASTAAYMRVYAILAHASSISLRASIYAVIIRFNKTLRKGARRPTPSARRVVRRVRIHVASINILFILKVRLAIFAHASCLVSHLSCLLACMECQAQSSALLSIISLATAVVCRDRYLHLFSMSNVDAAHLVLFARQEAGGSAPVGDGDTSFCGNCRRTLVATAKKGLQTG